MTPHEAAKLTPGDRVRVKPHQGENSFLGTVVGVGSRGAIVGVVKDGTDERWPYLSAVVELYKPMRPSKDQYYMSIAKTVSERATCDRKHVGAIIVNNDVVVATGYNGAPRGLPHCDRVGHEMEDGHCVRTVHAEQNCVAQAALSGAKTDGGTLYTTASPCYVCFKLLVNAGISKIVYQEFYREDRITALAAAVKIKLTQLKLE